MLILNAKFYSEGLFIDYGTSVLGEISSGDNGYGVTGILNLAGLGMVTQYPVGMSNNVARAIDCAASFGGTRSASSIATMVGQTAESNLVETGGLIDPEPLIFYQVRTVNSCNWEGP